MEPAQWKGEALSTPHHKRQNQWLAGVKPEEVHAIRELFFDNLYVSRLTCGNAAYTPQRGAKRIARQTVEETHLPLHWAQTFSITFMFGLGPQRPGWGLRTRAERAMSSHDTDAGVSLLPSRRRREGSAACSPRMKVTVRTRGAVPSDADVL